MKRKINSSVNEHKPDVHITRAIDVIEKHVRRLNENIENLNNDIKSLKIDERTKEYPSFYDIICDAKLLKAYSEDLIKLSELFDNEYEITF